MMKRAISILSCLLICISGLCQQKDIQALAAKMASSRISLSFRFNPAGKTKSIVAGTLTVQGNCFLVSTGSQRIISDGKTCWTVDDSTEEVYIEKGGRLPYFFTDPASMAAALSNVTRLSDGYRGVFTVPDDNQKYDFELRNIKTSAPTKGTAEFTFDPEKLGGDWVVTDLR